MGRERNKFTALRVLENSGLRIPKTIVEFGAQSAPEIPEEWDGLLYARVEDESAKLGRLGDRNVVSEWIEQNLVPHSTQTTTIQEFINFSFGGAAYLNSQYRYVEVAHGLPIGLLRKGELGLALLQACGTETVFVGSQSSSWHISSSNIRAFHDVNLLEHQLLEVARLVLQELSYASVEGLIEWGVVDGLTVYLDHHDYCQFGSGEILRLLTPSLYDLNCGQIPKRIPLPAMEYFSHCKEDLFLVERGARLSHLVTYLGSLRFTFLEV